VRPHLFLTGEIQAGKSTLLRRLLDRSDDLCIGGFRTVTAADVPGTVGSVYIVPASETSPVFSPECRAAIRHGPPRGAEGFPTVFDRRGVELLADAERAQLIIMDEIGFLETAAPRFCARVMELLDGDTPIIGVVRKAGETPLQQYIRSHPRVQLIEVTRENRDELAETLLPWIHELWAGGLPPGV